MATLKNESVFVCNNKVEVCANTTYEPIIRLSLTGSMESGLSCNDYPLLKCWYIAENISAEKKVIGFHIEPIAYYGTQKAFQSKIIIDSDSELPSIALMFALSLYEETCTHEYIERDENFLKVLIKGCGSLAGQLRLMPYAQILREFAVFGRWEHEKRNGWLDRCVGLTN